MSTGSSGMKTSTLWHFHCYHSWHLLHQITMLFTCCISHFKVLMKGGNSYKSSAGVMQSSLPVFLPSVYCKRKIAWHHHENKLFCCCFFSCAAYLLAMHTTLLAPLLLYYLDDLLLVWQEFKMVKNSQWWAQCSVEEVLDGQHQGMDVSTHAGAVHGGLLRKRLEEDLCWIIPHISPPPPPPPTPQPHPPPQQPNRSRDLTEQ